MEHQPTVRRTSNVGPEGSAQIVRSLVICGLIALSQNVAAQDGAGGYIGAEVGSLNYQEDLSDIAPGTGIDESSVSLKLFGGYRFGDHFGVEADWRTIDDLEASESVFIPDIGTLTTTAGAEIDAVTIRVLGYAPLSWGSFVYGAGYFDYDADVQVRATVQGGAPLPGPGSGPGPAYEIRDSVSDTGGTVMLGLQWALELLNIRLNYEWFDFDDADVWQIGVGASFRF